jgi:peptide/nickel transport system permease protein
MTEPFVSVGSFARSARIIIGATIVILMFGCAVLAPLIAPHDPNEQDLLAQLLPPQWSATGTNIHPLGTDNLGRDNLSRLIYGARVAMIVAVAASLGAMLIGATLAIIGGYFGGWSDWMISRAVELWLSFPPVVLSLLLIVGLGVGLRNVILAIILVDWTRFCRVVRSEAMVVRRADYIAAARLLGFSHLRTILRELLPAVLPVIITVLTLEMGIAVIVEAILSFVGMSVPASVPSWGAMIADARGDIYDTPWGIVFPVTAIVATVLGFNLVGDGLRRAADPRQMLLIRP